MDVSSLQQSCLQRIAKDMEYWCPSTTDNYSGYLYVLGPFDHLGSRQIQELIAVLAKKKILKASYLHSLLHYGITFLDLSPCKYLISDALIQMITKRCKKLCHLSLANCSRISVHLLQELTKNLPNLHSIDLSGTCSSCDDNVLVSLGKHCKDLQVLKLESCKKVTDRGLAALNNNPKLVEINLSATSVTPQGVFMLLQNHPHLQSLSLSMCKTTSESNITAKMEYFGDIFLSLGVTRLKYLDLSCSSANDDSIAVITTICPEISSLLITGFHGGSESLLHMRALEHLTHLELNGMDIDIDHITELQVFLQERGRHLETLYLYLTSDIDTGIIAHFCPNLTSLSLAGSEYITGSLAQYGNQELTLLEACPHLKVLNFQNCSFVSTNLRGHFSAIFGKSVSNLEELYLTDVYLVSEDFVQYIESPCFSNLRILDISSNDLVNKDLVLKIAQCCKRLQRLNVSGCWNVKLCDIEEAKQLLAQAGRQTEIIWS